jgi:hypothetical protein
MSLGYIYLDLLKNIEKSGNAKKVLPLTKNTMILSLRLGYSDLIDG